MLVNQRINLTLDGNIQQVSYQAGTAQVVTAVAAGTVTTAGNAKVTVTSPLVTGSPLDTSVALVAGTNQVETATVAGTIGASGAGNATVIVTAAGMTGSPKTISVAVANNDTASQVATKIRAALTADTAVAAMFTVSGATTAVILTAIAKAANDTTLNISIDNGTCTGLTTAATSTNTTAGVATDTASSIASKIRTALNAVGAITTPFTVGGSGANVTLTAVTIAANDNTLRIKIIDNTSVGVTTVYSQTTTAGVAAGALGTFTPKFLLQNPATNSHHVYVGHSSGADNTLPTTLDATHCLADLAPGDSLQVGEDFRSALIGENYILSHWVVKGTSTETIIVDYVSRVVAGNPS